MHRHSTGAWKWLNQCSTSNLQNVSFLYILFQNVFFMQYSQKIARIAKILPKISIFFLIISLIKTNIYNNSLINIYINSLKKEDVPTQTHPLNTILQVFIQSNKTKPEGDESKKRWLFILFHIVSFKNKWDNDTDEKAECQYQLCSFHSIRRHSMTGID